MDLSSVLAGASVDSEAGIFFVLSKDKVEKVSYRELYLESLLVLGFLQYKGVKAGDEMIIQLDNNRFFLTVFWACIIGKIIPVPLATAVKQDQIVKLFNVWDCLSNPYVVSNQEWIGILGKDSATSNNKTEFQRLKSRNLCVEEALLFGTQGKPGIIGPDDIAYVQFSSGSTGKPKGVVLTHVNLLTNIQDIIKSLEITDSDILLSWMPLFHDMGLIGFHFTGLVRRIDVVSMPTALFVRRPALWMDMVSTFRATVLYSPNFGFHYFLTGYRKKKEGDWDLNCVRLIVNGAENISGQLTRDFSAELSTYGLKENAVVAA